MEITRDQITGMFLEDNALVISIHDMRFMSTAPFSSDPSFSEDVAQDIADVIHEGLGFDINEDPMTMWAMRDSDDPATLWVGIQPTEDLN